MTQDEELFLEEVLLGYLRSSKKIKVTNLNISDENSIKKMTISFDIDQDFASTLVNSLNKPFANFIREQNK